MQVININDCFFSYLNAQLSANLVIYGMYYEHKIVLSDCKTHMHEYSSYKAIKQVSKLVSITL